MDARCSPLPDPEQLLCGCRVAFHVDNGITSVSAETAAAVRRAAQLLLAAGARVDELRPSALPLTREIMPYLFYGTDGGRGFRAYVQQLGLREVPALLENALERASAHQLDPAGCERVQRQWQRLRRDMLSFMQGVDLILCPVAAGPAPLHEASLVDDVMSLFSYSMTFNLTGFPSVTVRAGSSAEGLPIGVQLVARPWQEDLALAAAACVEEGVPPFAC
jgi:amidase